MLARGYARNSPVEEFRTFDNMRHKRIRLATASTSGHLVPKTDLIKMGIDPDKELKTVFAGSHPTSVLSMWNDKADAAASTETTLYQLADNKQIDFCGFLDGEVGKDRTRAEIQVLFDNCPNGKIAMLHYSDPIPNTPFAIRGDLPPSFKDAVKPRCCQPRTIRNSSQPPGAGSWIPARSADCRRCAW